MLGTPNRRGSDARRCCARWSSPRASLKPCSISLSKVSSLRRAAGSSAAWRGVSPPSAGIDSSTQSSKRCSRNARRAAAMSGGSGFSGRFSAAPPAAHADASPAALVTWTSDNTAGNFRCALGLGQPSAIGPLPSGSTRSWSYSPFMCEWSRTRSRGLPAHSARSGWRTAAVCHAGSADDSGRWPPRGSHKHPTRGHWFALGLVGCFGSHT